MCMVDEFVDNVLKFEYFIGVLKDFVKFDGSMFVLFQFFVVLFLVEFDQVLLGLGVVWFDVGGGKIGVFGIFEYVFFVQCKSQKDVSMVVFGVFLEDFVGGFFGIVLF